MPDFTAVTVTGTYEKAPGIPSTGFVTFTLSADLTNTTTYGVLAKTTFKAELDDGVLSAQLFAVDDSTTAPTGAVWNVVEDIDGVTRSSYGISLSHTMAPTVALHSLTPLIPTVGMGAYALKSDLLATELALTTSSNATIAIGDSITFISCDAAGLLRGPQSYFSWLTLLSDSQVNYLRNAGVPGDTAAQVLARIQTDVVAYGPRFCIVHIGTNDAYIASTTLASYAGSIKAIVAALRAANIKPILSTVMMRSDTGNALVETYNAWLHTYCKSQGIPLLPFYEAMLDPTTGLTHTAYTADGLHPSPAGAQVMGQAAATYLAEILPPWSPPLAMHSQSWSPNILPNGLFIANSGGLGTSWVEDQGAGTPSIVAGDGVNVLGNWQRLTENPHTNQTVIHSPINTVTVHPGDRLALCGWYLSSCTGPEGSAVTMYWWPSGAAVQPVFNFPGAISQHKFYVEAVAPAGNTGIAVYLILPAASGDASQAQVAQMTVLNLTQLGIPSLL